MAEPLVKFKLIGAKELEANLLALGAEGGERLAKSTLDRALKKVSEPIMLDAQHRSARRTGKNASKIIVSKNLSRRQRKGTTKVPGERIVYIGVRPSPVAHLIEFGTGPRHTKSGAYRGSMKAQPFLRPAWDGGKHAALDDFGRILGAEIERAAARLAKRNAKRAAS